MAEENLELEKEVVPTIEPEVEEVAPEREPTHDEQLASNNGWRPKDEWEGEPEDWVSAREFNRRGELFSRIAKYGNENREMRESLKKLFNHNRVLFDAGYKKAIGDLKGERAEAIEEGDTRKLVAIEDQMESLKDEHQRAIQEFDSSMTMGETQEGPNPQQAVVFNQWSDSNPWYGKNADLTKIADNIAKSMVESSRASGVAVDYGRLLGQVAREVRENNPEYFVKESKNSSVEGSSRTTTTRKAGGVARYSMNNIPSEEREIARTIMQSTGMKEEEYVKQYMSVNK